MRLIDSWTFALEDFDEDASPEYAILSHTWQDGEVSYADMRQLESARHKPGFTKIARAAELAIDEGLRWVWIDTCCINKESSAELQEAINSMWRWYSNAAVCYVFMLDLRRQMPYLTDDGAFRTPTSEHPLPEDSSGHPTMFKNFTCSRWFTRGWCLQELIAPKKLRFYSLRGNSKAGKCELVGEKSGLVRIISRVTKIDVAVLEHKVPLTSISVAQRMSWASKRQTRRVEDQAYSLLGIFDVSIPMLYGEGNRAFIRLQEEIMRTNSDHSLLAWGPSSKTSNRSLLATSPSDFANASRVVQWGHPRPFEMTNRGLRITLPVLQECSTQRPENLAILNCRTTDSLDHAIALPISANSATNECHITARHPTYYPLFYDTDARAGRLALVHTQDAKLAVPTELLIARIPEPRFSGVRFVLQLDTFGAKQSHQYVQEVYPEQEKLDLRAPVFFTTRKYVARAGAMLQYPSGRLVSLVFGFDRFPSHDEYGVLLPGVWARFHRGPQKLKDIVKLGHIHAHGRTYTCLDPRKSGCPYMPKTAHVKLQPEGDILDASIEHEVIFEEDVFVIRATLKQEYEMEASNSFISDSTNGVQYSSDDTPLAAREAALSWELLEASDEASFGAAAAEREEPRAGSPSTHSSTAAPERPTPPVMLPARPRGEENSNRYTPTVPHVQLMPFHPEVQAMPAPSESSVQNAQSFSTFRDRAGHTYASWGIGRARGIVNPPDVDAQLLEPLRFMIQPGPKDPVALPLPPTPSLHPVYQQTWPPPPPREQEKEPRVYDLTAAGTLGSAFESEGASEAFATGVNVGAVGIAGLEDFCIEEVD